MSDVAELAGRLVEIESINPDVVTGGSGELGLARFVAEWCERAGLEVRDRAGHQPLGRVERGRHLITDSYIVPLV